MTNLGAETGWKTTSCFLPKSSFRLSTIPQGVIPIETTLPPLILGDFSDMSASPTCLLTPVLVPPVKIHAPVVFAAFKRPRLSDLLIRGCNSKLALPPVVVISNLGRSKHHSRKSKLSTNSGLVSKDKRMYWALLVWAPRKSMQLKLKWTSFVQIWTYEKTSKNPILTFWDFKLVKLGKLSFTTVSVS